MKPNPWLTKIVLLVTALSLSGLPAMAQAITAPQNQQQPQPAPGPGTGQVDPSAGPKTPVPSRELPEAPTPSDQAAPAPQAQPPTAGNAQSSDKQKGALEPLGTATAERGTTAGGPASKPAGMAIAPAKQKQTRSLLIKIGAVAAAGAAFGIVYGLTRSTPSLPPNAAAAH